MATGGLKLCAGVLAACLSLLGLAAEATAQAQPNRDTARSTIPRATLQPARPLPPGQAPPMMLAQATATTRDALPLPVTRYWVSEKYDGVRAWWDGHTLRTRQGHRIAAPDWFTAGWPRVAMDGELWAGRGRFEVSSATVQSLQPGDDAWRGLRFMVFDLPEQAGPFQARLAQLQALAGRPAAAGPTTPTWAPVPQWREASFTSLQAKLRQVHDHGAEGLMLHDDQALHVVGRSPALIKFKPLDDAEAVVIGHVPGQGKHTGRLGALVVRNAAGQEFRIGTGFTDAERSAPPALGSIVSYAHQGVTAKGLPRFTRFVRVRTDLRELPR
ncbi:DNA ligase [Comamonas serinivorans]|uniref:DNA ligase n=1 Tax=Comamonas serinivorans TaxID=1082851 RepID=A0A1Y0ENA2_9BURK|nr:DNA ligase [Comamonas serinivorans]ARU04908.1 DNA ligase [Comamonas serinivorans]